MKSEECFELLYNAVIEFLSGSLTMNDLRSSNEALWRMYNEDSSDSNSDCVTG